MVSFRKAVIVFYIYLKSLVCNESYYSLECVWDCSGKTFWESQEASVEFSRMAEWLLLRRLRSGERERRKHKAQEGNQRVDSFKEEKSMVSCATERSSCRKTGKCGRRKKPWTIVPECDLYSISYLHIRHFDIVLCMKTETELQRLECMLAWRGTRLIIARMLIPPWLFLYNHTLVVVENNFQKDEIMTVM